MSDSYMETIRRDNNSVEVGHFNPFDPRPIRREKAAVKKLDPPKRKVAETPEEDV